MGDTTNTDDKVVEPGQLGEDGKYTDEGLASLVDKIAKGEPDAEGSDVDKDDDADKGKPKSKKKDAEKMVPISRLNEVIEERNRLRDQMPKATTQQPVREAPLTAAQLRTQLNTKRTEWQKAIMDNDSDSATSLLGQLNTLEAQIDNARTAEVQDTARALSADDIRYDTLLAKLLEDHPVIDKNSEDFDQTVVAEMYDMREAYIATGLTQSEALNKAAKYILKDRGNPKKAKAVTDDRNNNSKKVLADALTRQPSDVSDLGDAADKINNNKFGIDVKRLKPEQFDKLPDDVKKQLRGDTVQAHHLGFAR